MDKIIIIKNDDGSCAIIHPAPEMFNASSRTRQDLPELENATEEQILQYIINKDVPEGKEYRIADKSALPSDRFFRMAWTDDNPTPIIDIDLERAKEVKKVQFRGLRAPILSDLDVAYMRADEAQDENKKQKIREQKQALRDVTTIDMPSNVEELKEFIPDILKSE